MARYRTQRVDERPNLLHPGVLYVVGKEKLFCAAMLCPCGCGDDLYMSLVDGDSPRWRVKTYRDGTSTMTPSVWRRVGCKSHFILFRGRPLWCRSRYD